MYADSNAERDNASTPTSSGETDSRGFDRASYVQSRGTSAQLSSVQRLDSGSRDTHEAFSLPQNPAQRPALLMERFEAAPSRDEPLSSERFRLLFPCEPDRDGIPRITIPVLSKVPHSASSGRVRNSSPAKLLPSARKTRFNLCRSHPS